MIKEFILVTLYISFLVTVFTIVGRKILRLFPRLDEGIMFDSALSYLLGLSLFVDGLILIGVLRWFRLSSVLIFIGLLTIIAIPDLGKILTHIKQIKIEKKYLLILAFFIFLVGVNYVACFAPPNAWDEVAYHLPEAKNILLNHGLIFPVNGHPFYGNLPLSMEVLYAFGILISGFALAHVFHFTFLLAMLLAIGSFLQKRYSATVGIVAGILIFFLSELVGNATSGYIDAASTTYEIIGLLLILGWINSQWKKNQYLYLSGLFYGLSLGIKYTAFYSLVVVLSILGIIIIAGKKLSVKEIAKKIGWFFVFVTIGGGFWYAKNWIVNGNPLYPYFFGHRGMTNEALADIDRLVKSFVAPRDLIHFVEIPYIFFFSRMKSLQDGLVFLLFILTPLAIFEKKSRQNTIIILSIILINLALWFFVITHQTRFLFSTLILLAICSAIAIAKLKLLRIKTLIFIAGIFFVINISLHIIPGSLIIESINTNLFRSSEVKLLIGKTSKIMYLEDKVGVFIFVTDYINFHYSNQSIINFWNHNAYFYLDNGNRYTLDCPEDPSQFGTYIKDNNLTLLAIDSKMRQDFINNPDWAVWRKNRLQFEEYFKTKAILIYSYKGDELYEII